MPLAYIPDGWRKGKLVVLAELPALNLQRPHLLIDSGNKNYNFVEWSHFEYYSLKELLLSVLQGHVFIAEKIPRGDEL